MNENCMNLKYSHELNIYITTNFESIQVNNTYDNWGGFILHWFNNKTMKNEDKVIAK